MELDQYERKELSPNKTHPYICTIQHIVNNPKSKSVLNNNSNSDFILVKNLQKENELLRNKIKTYQMKYEILNSNHNNASTINLNNSNNIKEHNKYKSNKSLVNSNNINLKLHNTDKQTLLTTVQKKIISKKIISNQKISKTKQSSTSSTPKQRINELSSLNNRFMNRSTKKIIPNTKVNSLRTSTSHLKGRTPRKVNNNQYNEITSNNITISTNIRNESCIINRKKYNNFLEEFDTFKLVNFNKKENNNNPIKRKSSTINEDNKKVRLKRPGYLKYNSSITNSNGGVIINNVNYINVFPDNYNNNLHKMNVLKHKIKHPNILNKKS